MIPSARFAAIVTIFVIGWTAAVSSTSPPDPALRGLVRLLHDGRFDEADELARTLGEARPDDPAVAFAQAFVTWWRLLYDDESSALEATFEARIVRATQVGAAALGRRDRPEDRVWAGYSRLLCAQLRASQKKTLAAAREAKEAHRLLTEASRLMPASPDALFGLGTYNYYADRGSALVRGLRALLGLPAGNRVKGLEQLERAANAQGFFSLESRLLRATIFAGKRERSYAAALTETGRALEVESDAITALDAAARLDLVLGREDVAASRLDRALDLAGDTPGTHPSVRSALRLERARVEFARLRPDRALEQLRKLRDGAPRLPARVAREAERLAVVSEWLMGAGRPGAPPAAGSPPGHEVWARIARAMDLESSDGINASVRALETASRELAGDPNVTLFLGLAQLGAGQGDDALATLTAADLSARLPDPWVGPYRLLAGQAADLAGDRAKARELYLKASKSPPFIELPATTFRAEVAYTGAR